MVLLKGGPLTNAPFWTAQTLKRRLRRGFALQFGELFTETTKVQRCSIVTTRPKKFLIRANRQMTRLRDLFGLLFLFLAPKETFGRDIKPIIEIRYQRQSRCYSKWRMDLLLDWKIRMGAVERHWSKWKGDGLLWAVTRYERLKSSGACGGWIQQKQKTRKMCPDYVASRKVQHGGLVRIWNIFFLETHILLQIRFF